MEKFARYLLVDGELANHLGIGLPNPQLFVGSLRQIQLMAGAAIICLALLSAVVPIKPRFSFLHFIRYTNNPEKSENALLYEKCEKQPSQLQNAILHFLHFL